MAIEDFKHLIEAQSLEKKMKEHLDATREQVSRVKHIEKQREINSSAKIDLESQLSEKSTELSKKEKDLFDSEAKAEKTNEHIPLARNEQETNALQKELDVLNPKIEKLQEEILELMEVTEELCNQISEKDEFLKGSLLSLEKIKKDSEIEIHNEEEKIKVLEERVSSLLSQTGENYRTAYLLSNEKHKFNNPLCFVSNSACHICRYTLNQMQATEIEKGEVTESCPGCGRLITPLSAKTL